MARFFSRGEFEELLRASGFADVWGADLTLGIASVVRGEKPR
jgi:ubiquinone/menaquinone biosynthesis C-methylase UbiE